MRRQKRPFCPQKTWKSVRLIWKFHRGTQSRRRVEGLNTGLHEYVWQGKKEPESSAGHLLRLLVISGHLSQLSGGSNGMELKWPQAGFGVERGAEVKYKRIHEDSHSLMDFLSGNIQFVAHSWNSSEQCFREVGVRGYVCMFQMLFWTINLNAIILIIVIFFFYFPGEQPVSTWNDVPSSSSRLFLLSPHSFVRCGFNHCLPLSVTILFSVIIIDLFFCSSLYNMYYIFNS